MSNEGSPFWDTSDYVALDIECDVSTIVLDKGQRLRTSWHNGLEVKQHLINI